MPLLKVTFLLIGAGVLFWLLEDAIEWVYRRLKK